MFVTNTRSYEYLLEEINEALSYYHCIYNGIVSVSYWETFNGKVPFSENAPALNRVSRELHKHDHLH